ncbi:hypothetical protein JCM3765_003084 [Sporobolomyces pararoseus]
MASSTSIPSLRLVSEHILRYNWVHVRDVGDCPYEVVSNLLKLSTASQLTEIEENSPHLAPHTNDIWKQLCVSDFVEIRKLVEDGKLDHPETEDESWKARYYEEEEKKQVKMKLVLEKLRGQYSELDEKKQSRQVQSIDGLRFEKRRKLTSGGGGGSSSQRPKSLLQKARHNTKAITSIYAPKRKPVQAPSARKVPALATAFPSSRKPAPNSPIALPSSTTANPYPISGTNGSKPNSVPPPPPVSNKRPVIRTVTRTTTTTKRSSALNSAGSPPPRQTSFSPPPSSSFVVPPARPIAQIPLRARPAPPPAPPALPRAASPPTAAPRKDLSKKPPLQMTSPHSSAPPISSPKHPPTQRRAPAAVRGGLFIPKKR